MSKIKKVKSTIDWAKYAAGDPTSLVNTDAGVKGEEVRGTPDLRVPPSNIGPSPFKGSDGQSQAPAPSRHSPGTDLFPIANHLVGSGLKPGKSTPNLVGAAPPNMTSSGEQVVNVDIYCGAMDDSCHRVVAWAKDVGTICGHYNSLGCGPHHAQPATIIHQSGDLVRDRVDWTVGAKETIAIFAGMGRMIGPLHDDPAKLSQAEEHPTNRAQFTSDGNVYPIYVETWYEIVCADGEDRHSGVRVDEDKGFKYIDKLDRSDPGHTCGPHYLRRLTTTSERVYRDWEHSNLNPDPTTTFEIREKVGDVGEGHDPADCDECEVCGECQHGCECGEIADDHADCEVCPRCGSCCEECGSACQGDFEDDGALTYALCKACGLESAGCNCTTPCEACEKELVEDFIYADILHDVTCYLREPVNSADSHAHQSHFDAAGNHHPNLNCKICRARSAMVFVDGKADAPTNLDLPPRPDSCKMHTTGERHRCVEKCGWCSRCDEAEED